jgi:two-component system, OmpR family, KDP operon response regulator KdpE
MVGVRPVQPVTILIAEDDSTTRWALTALLRAEGYRTLAVTSGREAVAAFEAVRPDFVIVDYGLPDMSGLDVLEEIEPTAGRPIALIVTGEHLGREARDAARDLGARIFRKPLSPSDFLAFVRNAGCGLA